MLSRDKGGWWEEAAVTVGQGLRPAAWVHGGAKGDDGSRGVFQREINVIAGEREVNSG